MRSKKFTFILSAIFLLLLSSCSYHSHLPYPVEWPAATEAAAPDISGLYSNFEDGGTARLTSFFFELFSEMDHKRTTLVEIKELGNKSIEVIARKSRSIIGSMTIALNKSDSGYAMTKEGLKRTVTPRFVSKNGIGGVAHTWHAFTKGQDGSLIIKETSRLKGSVFCVPFRAHGTTDWFRYKAIIKGIIE